MRRLVATAILVTAGLLGGGADAQLKSRPDKVVLFKNGLAFVEELASGTTADPVAVFPLHAPPLFGSLQIRSLTPRKILSLTTSPTRPVGSAAAQRLGQGAGTTVFVTSGTRTNRGILVGELPLTSGGNEMLVLEAQGGTVLVPVAGISSIELEGSGSNLLRPVAQVNWPVQLRLDGPGDLSFSGTYLTRDNGWAPEYRVEMLPDGKAKIWMTAVVVSNTLAFADTEVRFSTGEGLFPFQWTDSPLFQESAQVSNLSSLVMGTARPGGYRGREGRHMMAQQSMDNAFAPDVDGQDVAPEAEGQESFLYGPARLTLARGERAVVPLFELDLTGQIMVVWEPGYASHLEVSSAQPWLASVVRNTGTAPWTTGAALVTQDGRPLGQGTLSYTSKGSEAVVKVALATSVRCSLKEDQIERVEKAKTMGRTHYDKVTMQGTLEVTSTRKDVVTLRIRKDVLGKVLETSDSGKVTEKTQVPGSLVPNSTINWERQIPADGKTLSITYRYETYVVTGSNYSAE